MAVFQKEQQESKTGDIYPPMVSNRTMEIKLALLKEVNNKKNALLTTSEPNPLTLGGLDRSSRV